MTSEKLHALHQARPFSPFTLHLADGRAIQVRHPEFFAYNPAGRTALVLGEEEKDFDIVDVLLITSITVGKGSSNGRRKKRRA